MKFLKWLLGLFKIRKPKRKKIVECDILQKTLLTKTNVLVKMKHGIVAGEIIKITSGKKHCWVKTKYGIIRKPLNSIIDG